MPETKNYKSMHVVKPKGITTQESGESRGGGDEKITEKGTQENNYEAKEPETGDKKTEENVEEI